MSPGAGLRDLLESAVSAHRSGALQQAESLYRQVISADARNAGALHLLGVLHYQRGVFGEAERLIGEAIAVDPSRSAYHNDLGEALRVQGKLHPALGAYACALDLTPGHAGALNNRGIALQALGRVEEALFSFQSALQGDPEFGEAAMNLGNLLREQGRLDAALDAFGQAAGTAVAAMEGAVNCAATLLSMGRTEEGVERLEVAADRWPDRPEVLVSLGNALLAAGRHARALEYIAAALQVAPHFVEAHVALGQANLELGRLEAAGGAYREAIRLSPEDGALYGNLAQVYARQGDREALVALARPLLGGDSGLQDSASQATRGADTTETGGGRLPVLADAERARLHFSLGKVHDQEGAYDEAFAQFRQANRLACAGVVHTEDVHETLTAASLKLFSEDFISARRGFGTRSKVPVFIVGMPRSGTTLVEQILASHTQVHGAGELDFFQRLIDTLPERLGERTAAYPSCLDKLDAAQTRAIAVEYLRSLPAAGPGVLRITDKMPHNFLCLGLIALLFPEATIIHCRRDPLDVCLSIYFTSFDAGNTYAYDLLDIGRYYARYHRLMRHWKQVLPVRLHDVRYESLVAAQETQTRALLAHCGLGWEDACLAFHRTERPVRTASAAQVRQPLYARAVGRWRHYERHLGELRRVLGDLVSAQD